MPAKPHARNWNDVQTAIAALAVVSSLGLWNLFATPAKTETVKSTEPVLPPTDVPQSAQPVAMPQVKIIFTQAAPQTTLVPQVLVNQQAQNKKKKNKNNNGGSSSTTQTRTS